MTTNFDFDLLTEIAENAPVAGSSNYINLGRVWMDNLQVSQWDNGNKKFVKEEYTGGKLEEGQTLEFQIHQEIDKKDGDTFVKTWYVQLKESGKRSKTDWGEVIKPSVIKTFKDLKSFFKGLSGNGSYMAVEDFDTGRDSKKNDNNGNPYPVTTPKFISLFKGEKEMKAEKARREALRNEFPPSDNGSVPQSVINSFKGVVTSAGSLEDAIELINEQSDGEYEGYPVATVADLAFPVTK